VDSLSARNFLDCTHPDCVTRLVEAWIAFMPVDPVRYKNHSKFCVMQRFFLEKELCHLEHIVPQASAGPLSFQYWHTRVDALRLSTSVLPFIQRLDRLKRILSTLESESRGS
jgi:hypothetical protein